MPQAASGSRSTIYAHDTKSHYIRRAKQLGPYTGLRLTVTACLAEGRAPLGTVPEDDLSGHDV